MFEYLGPLNFFDTKYFFVFEAQELEVGLFLTIIKTLKLLYFNKMNCKCTLISQKLDPYLNNTYLQLNNKKRNAKFKKT